MALQQTNSKELSDNEEEKRHPGKSIHPQIPQTLCNIGSQMFKLNYMVRQDAFAYLLHIK
jgi:hypothetical protein